MSLTVCTLSFGADTEVNPVRRLRPEAPEADVQKLIVKFREESLDGATGPASMKRADRSRERAIAVAQRASLTLEKSHELVAGMHAMQVRVPASGESLATTLARLRADPAVAYAEPDYRRHILAAPNDPLFLGQQWHLKNDAGTPSAIDALGAWDATQGGDGTVIAVVDTGVRFDHPDLGRVASAGRLLDGYDFVTDPETANDGDGPDADASDPGDWCQGSSSSWHGTLVSGIVGATTNNATGIAGITWNGRILPVRGLGKCGGDDSDIISAVLWAAGIPVSGVPDNPDPAKIINLSLGSTGSCPVSWQDAISQVVARGVLVVVAAGNESGPVGSPANCRGVAAVAALRHAGTKVGFSSLGREVALGAPGGNCVNPSGACLYSIDSTSNDGVTTPGASTYTDQVNFNVGTSFSAPIVAGIAALMAAVNGQLDSAQLIDRLRSGSKPFPKSSDTTVPDCHVPAGGSDLQPRECNCTTDTCGAGMANANGSVTEALRPVAVPTAEPTTAASGQTVNLDASGSFASNNRSIAGYAWTVVSSSGEPPVIANANRPNASFTATNGGVVTVRLTVTDSEGAQDSAAVGVSALAPVTVTVFPSTASVSAGGGTQAFTATVENTLNTAVTWQVGGVTGGNSTVGTISTSGLYTAPVAVPSSATVTVSALSNADNTRTGSAQVTITRTLPASSGGGGGGAIDAAWLLVCLLTLLPRRTMSMPPSSKQRQDRQLGGDGEIATMRVKRSRRRQPGQSLSFASWIAAITPTTAAPMTIPRTRSSSLSLLSR
ncbi:MAG: S8 family serine peptidase [Proteobacteria bacterium]|nr:S8 family serine peptidase [Pseudomonadota bacterium]